MCRSVRRLGGRSELQRPAEDGLVQSDAGLHDVRPDAAAAETLRHPRHPDGRHTRHPAAGAGLGESIRTDVIMWERLELRHII